MSISTIDMFLVAPADDRVAPLVEDAPRVACRECGVIFEDLSGHQLCDACLVEYINGAGELELDDDDLFSRPPRAVARQLATPDRRFACVVCALRANALVCKECALDATASRQRVQAQLTALLARMDDEVEAFEVQAQASAEWRAIQAAQVKVDAGEMPLADFAARGAERKAQGGGWQVIIEAAEARDQALIPLAAERDRLEKALLALGAMV